MVERFYELIDNQSGWVYLGIAENPIDNILKLRNYTSMSLDVHKSLKPLYKGSTSSEISKKMWEKATDKIKSYHSIKLKRLDMASLNL